MASEPLFFTHIREAIRVLGGHMASRDISKTEYFEAPVASTRDAALGPKRKPLLKHSKSENAADRRKASKPKGKKDSKALSYF